MKIQPAHIYLIMILVFAVFTMIKVNQRQNELKEMGEETVVKITDIQERTKGKSTRTTIAYYEFKTESGEKVSGYEKIANSSVKEGNCYKALYSTANPKVIDITFKMTVPCQ